MYTNYHGIEEYPYEGFFYKMGVDESKPLDQQFEEKVHIFDTRFDLSEGVNNDTKMFLVSFPFNHDGQKIEIYEGVLFEGVVFGMMIKGRVIAIYPSQLGGCTVLCTRI